MRGMELFKEVGANPTQHRFFDPVPKKANKYWIAAQTLPQNMDEPSRQKHRMCIAGELAVLQSAYPTQARNFTKGEIETTHNLWSEVFARVHPQLLHAAIQRFITEDRKGFFPAPGQVVAHVEQIMNEIATKEQSRIDEEIFMREFNSFFNPQESQKEAETQITKAIEQRSFLNERN